MWTLSNDFPLSNSMPIVQWPLLQVSLVFFYNFLISWLIYVLGFAICACRLSMQRPPSLCGISTPLRLWVHTVALALLIETLNGSGFLKRCLQESVLWGTTVKEPRSAPSWESCPCCGVMPWLSWSRHYCASSCHLLLTFQSYSCRPFLVYLLPVAVISP